MKILIVPVGEIEVKILNYLEKELEKRFNLAVEIDKAMEKPGYAYNPRRGQYLATAILEKVEKIKPDQIKLGIVEVDLYASGLNFVFGEASPFTKTAVISLIRLREDFYGLPENKALFKERAIKEAVHEVGHLFGFDHCRDPKCVMHFSNSLPETDRKSSYFCPNCQKKLKAR